MTLHDTQPPVAQPGVLQLAENAAETIRDLNHLTRGHDAFADAAELSRLIAELAIMTSRLPQLLDQLNRWLGHEHHAARIRADTDADPDELVSLAAAQLTRASRSAHNLTGILDTAHQHAAHLATHTGAAPDRRTIELPTQGVSIHP